MDSNSALQLIILILLLVLSGFFSSAETSLTTVSTIRLLSLAEQGNKRAQTVLKIRKDSGKMLSAILIGNNIVNLTASSLATTLAINLLGSATVGIATGILTFLVLMFGEITPKTLATIHAEKFALSYANVSSWLMKILTPVIFIINHLSRFILKLLHVDPNAKPSFMTEHELRTIVDVSHENGVIESDERQMINNVFDFGDSTAKDIMIPRVDMVCADIDSTYEELLEIFRAERFTRIPVYEGDGDNMVGVINMKDLLLFHPAKEFHIRDIMREPYFTYEYKKTSELMVEMRKDSVNFTIVLDEYGATVGMITLEDLLEEIVGDIRDEYDHDEEDPIRRIQENEYQVLGSSKLDDLNEKLGIHLESEDYDSIGGYIIEHLDHLPKAGEFIVTEDGIRLVVDTVTRKRIDRVHIYLPPKKEEDETEENYL